MDTTECGSTNKRQMTTAADSLYRAVLRAQTVTLLALAPVSAIPPLALTKL